MEPSRVDSIFLPSNHRWVVQLCATHRVFDDDRKNRLKLAIQPDVERHFTKPPVGEYGGNIAVGLASSVHEFCDERFSHGEISWTYSRRSVRQCVQRRRLGAHPPGGQQIFNNFDIVVAISQKTINEQLQKLVSLGTIKSRLTLVQTTRTRIQIPDVGVANPGELGLYRRGHRAANRHPCQRHAAHLHPRLQVGQGRVLEGGPGPLASSPSSMSPAGGTVSPSPST